MSETMIERVARAIALAQLYDETRDVVDPETCPVADSYCDIARAALEAMRVPTKPMLQAIYDMEQYWIGGHAWQAAIDAALSEKR